MDGNGVRRDDLLDRLELAARVTERVIAGICEDQWGLPTPCTEWTVADVVDHLAAGNDRFTEAFDGGPVAGWSLRGRGGGQEGAALAGRYRESVRALLGAARRPGALDGPVPTPLGSVPGPVALYLRMTDLLVHGWDLARATGQDAAAPDALAEHLVAFSEARLPDVPPERRPFAPSRPVAADAPAIDRLAALLGREVAVPT